MAQQDNVGALVTYGIESAIGTSPSGSGTSQRLRRVSSSLNLSRPPFQSAEVRPDFQVSAMRLGGHQVGGAIEGELSIGTWDDFLDALLRTTAAGGASASNSDFTSITVSGGTATIGSGSFLSKGFKIGDIVRFTGMSAAANNNTNFRITSLTASTLTTSPALTDMTSDTSFTMAVVGHKSVMGTSKTSFTIEHYFPDTDEGELFSGCRLSGAAFNLQPNGMAGISLQFMGLKGQNISGSSAPYFTSATAATVSDVLTAIEGGIRLGGAERADITGLNFQVAQNQQMQPVIGSLYSPDVFYGRMLVSGNLTAFYSKATADLFVNETVADLVFAANASGGAPQDFICFNMQNVRLSSAQKTIAAEGGLIAQHSFQALLKTGGSGTAYDQSSLVIQRSN